MRPLDPLGIHDLTTPENPLKAWLLKHDVSYEELARRLEMSLNSVSRYCRDKVRPSDNAKVNIAKVTREMEREKKVDAPRGVQPADWFAPEPGTRRKR